ncbi:MAG: nucleotidyltransferase family protein [bacterium]
MNKEEVKEKIGLEIDFLREKYHIERIGVFGSVARDENNEKSDIDILVDFSTPIGFFDFIRLETFLSKILGKEVDLISRRALKPSIKEDVLRETIYV